MPESRDWTAFGTSAGGVNAEPQLWVNGVVDLPNPGCRAEVVEERSGINPLIKMLGVVITQLPGAWPEVITPTSVQWRGSVLPDSTHAQVREYETVEVTWL